MRTLQLTHEQVELLTQALGIAENSCLSVSKEIIEKLVLVRGNNNADNEIANHFQKKASALAELNLLITNSDLDV